MPRAPRHALIWSAEQILYGCSTQGQVVHRFQAADEAAWLTWLGGVTSLAFHGRSGSLNVYQEQRPRGGRYWHACHTARDGIRKRYLRQTAQVTLARLEETAQALASAAAPPPPLPPRPAPSDATAGREATPPVLLATKLTPPWLLHALVERPCLLSERSEQTRRH